MSQNGEWSVTTGSPADYEYEFVASENRPDPGAASRTSGSFPKCLSRGILPLRRRQNIAQDGPHALAPEAPTPHVARAPRAEHCAPGASIRPKALCNAM
eukprot:COSAG02_NODE_4314_length_5519_cov_3.105904_2_plen_99_part_00